MGNQAIKSKKGIWSFAFTGFIFMSAVLCMGASVIIPAIPNIMRDYGLSSYFITLAFVTLLFGRFLSSIFAGYILLKFRPHQVLFASFIMHAITMFFLIYARTGLEFSILRFMEGIFEGIVSVILQEIVIGLSTPEDRGIKIGYMQSAFGFGFIIGPIISSVTMKYFGSPGVFGIVVVLIFISILWLILIYRSVYSGMTRQKIQRVTLNLDFLKYLPFYGGPILQRILMVAFSMLIPLFLVDKFVFKPYQVGYFFTISAIITTSTMPFTGRLGKSRYCNYIVTGAMIVMGLSIIGMGLTNSSIFFTSFFILETIGFAIMAPNAMKIFGDMIANHERRAEIIGTSSSTREVFNILATFFLIPIYNFNGKLPWILLATFCILLSIPYMKSNNNSKADDPLPSVSKTGEP